MKRLQKISALLLSVIMLITCAVTVGAESADSVPPTIWDGTSDSTWISENAETKKATLTTPEQFAALATSATANGNFAGWEITLGADLYFNAGNAADWETEKPANTWTCIPSFCGTLNGNGHSLNGLYFKNIDVEYVGVFKQLGNGANIQNIAILNSYFLGFQFVGSVAGGIVRTTSPVMIENVYSNAYIRSDTTSQREMARIGGILGSAFDTNGQTVVTVRACTFAGTVYADATYGAATANDCATRVGGIVGQAYQTAKLTVEDCIVTGTVIGHSQVGGILGSVECGSNARLLQNCAFFGKLVVQREQNNTFSGSMIGIIFNGSSNVTIDNCYYYSDYQAINTANIPNTAKAAKVWSSNGTPTVSGSGAVEVSKADYIASGAAEKMSGLDYECTWSAANNNYTLPMLNSTKTLFSSAAIRYAGFQTDGKGNVRFLAVLDGIEAYASITYKIEMVRTFEDGTSGTMVLDEAHTTVYPSVNADGETVTAEELGGNYIYGYAVNEITEGAVLQFNVTPMLTCTNGVVVTGQTVSVVYCN